MLILLNILHKIVYSFGRFRFEEVKLIWNEIIYILLSSDVFIIVVNFLAIFMCISVCMCVALNAQFISIFYALLVAICEFIDEYRTERKCMMHNERDAENWNESTTQKKKQRERKKRDIVCIFVQ